MLCKIDTRVWCVCTHLELGYHFVDSRSVSFCRKQQESAHEVLNESDFQMSYDLKMPL